MIVKFLSVFISCLVIPVTSAKNLRTEKLSNGSQIAFYTIDDKPLSKKQLRKIENEINIRINAMSKLFTKQDPKKNLLALYQFKQYLDNIPKDNKTKYRITNTPLNSRIFLLSYFLDSLPDKNTFNPKNCQDYIHRLTVKAHVSLQGDELSPWLDQVLQLVHTLCPKKIPLKAERKSLHETI